MKRTFSTSSCLLSIFAFSVHAQYISPLKAIDGHTQTVNEMNAYLLANNEVTNYPSSGGHDWPGGYAYAPAIVQENGTYHMFFCSTGTDHRNSTNTLQDDWDYIRYSTSTDGFHWTTPTIALQPTLGTTVANADNSTCDPSIIKGGDNYYYMYYTGAIANYQGAIFVARSSSIEGPYNKYRQDGTWGTADAANPPKALVKTQNQGPSWAGDFTGGYGVGQQIVIRVNSTIHMWYTYGRDQIYEERYMSIDEDASHYPNPDGWSNASSSASSLNSIVNSGPTEVVFDDRDNTFNYYYMDWNDVLGDPTKHNSLFLRKSSQPTFNPQTYRRVWKAPISDTYVACEPGMARDNQGHRIPPDLLVYGYTLHDTPAGTPLVEDLYVTTMTGFMTGAILSPLLQ